MRALTIKQPWASLIIHCGKDIENREWAAPEWMIGKRIAIHSSKKVDRDDWDDAIDLVQSRGLPNFDLTPRDYPGGYILGTVLLAASVTESESLWFVGTHGFVLKDPLPIKEPIQIKGALGFWNVPPYIEELMRST